MKNNKKSVEKSTVNKLCENCGRKISKERLNVIPDTEYCVECVDICGPQRVINPDDVCAQPSIIDENDSD